MNDSRAFPICLCLLLLSNAAAARQFYGELLGYPVVTPRDPADPLVARISSRQSLVLEPGLQPDEDDRLSHIAFATSELTSMKAYLESRGVLEQGDHLVFHDYLPLFVLCFWFFVFVARSS